MKYAYKIDNKVFESHVEAEDHALVSSTSGPIEEVELQPGQRVIEGRIVEPVDSPDEPQLEYKVSWNTQEIPFWANFEGAKACVLAINTNKSGSRARLISFVREKEIEL